MDPGPTAQVVDAKRPTARKHSNTLSVLPYLSAGNGGRYQDWSRYHSQGAHFHYSCHRKSGIVRGSDAGTARCPLDLGGEDILARH